MSAITIPTRRHQPANVEASLSRQGRDGLPHRRRGGDLHDLRRRLPLLRGEEPQRPDAARGAGDARSSSRSACCRAASRSTSRQGPRARRARRVPRLWLLTIALGGLFLFGTGQEWHRLIYEHGLTISTNLFGTTYYSLVGLHAVPRHRRPGHDGRSWRCSRSSGASAGSTRRASTCSRSTGTSWTPSGSSCSPSST